MNRPAWRERRKNFRGWHLPATIYDGAARGAHCANVAAPITILPSSNHDELDLRHGEGQMPKIVEVATGLRTARMTA